VVSPAPGGGTSADWPAPRRPSPQHNAPRPPPDGKPKQPGWRREKVLLFAARMDQAVTASTPTPTAPEPPFPPEPDGLDEEVRKIPDVLAGRRIHTVGQRLHQQRPRPDRFQATKKRHRTVRSAALNG